MGQFPPLFSHFVSSIGPFLINPAVVNRSDYVLKASQGEEVLVSRHQPGPSRGTVANARDDAFAELHACSPVQLIQARFIHRFCGRPSILCLLSEICGSLVAWADCQVHDIKRFLHPDSYRVKQRLDDCCALIYMDIPAYA